MGKGANPLDVSPANNEVSQVRDALKEGLGMETTKSTGPSKGSSPNKGAAGKKYEKESELQKHSAGTRGPR